MDYDLYDRIETVDTNDKSITYEYDDFGRIKRENNEVLDKTIIYEYNEFAPRHHRHVQQRRPSDLLYMSEL